jgi:hypothetical protein
MTSLPIARLERRHAVERFDFQSSPTDPLHLYLLMKDLRRAAG